MQTRNSWNRTKRILFSVISIPKPVALPMEEFLFDKAGEDVYTWEKWQEESKTKFPVRYFLTEDLPKYWRRYIWGDYAPVNRFLYWFRCNTYNRYHLLDLRQPEGNDDSYRWGWIDADRQMLLGCFNILKNYVEKEKPFSPRDHYSAEEIENDPSLKSQAANYDEIMVLYHYWIVDRKAEQEKLNTILETVSKKEKIDWVVYSEHMNEYWKKVIEFEDTEERMLTRLIKIRKGLWT